MQTKVSMHWANRSEIEWNRLLAYEILFIVCDIETLDIIRKTKNQDFKNEKSKKEVDVTITVSNKDIV